MTNFVVNKNLELKSSFEWIRSSFYTFRERPIHFILLSLFGMLMNFIPLFGAFMSPLLIARFALLAQKIEHQEEITFSTIFEKLFANLTLVRLSFLSFSITAIIFIGQYLLEYVLVHFNQSIPVEILHKIAVAVSLIPIIILQVALWLAPIICLNNPEINPRTAMALSLKAGAYNIATFIVYTLLLVVFTILAILPIGLGLLIWVPVLNLSSFYIYKSLILVENN